MTKEHDLRIWCAECAFLSEPEECVECRDGFEHGSMPTHWTPSRKVKKPTTNADRIRAMSDEELAVLLEGCICPSEPCKKVVNRERQPDKKMCQSCWLDWLKQEVRDD